MVGGPQSSPQRCPGWRTRTRHRGCGRAFAADSAALVPRPPWHPKRPNPFSSPALYRPRGFWHSGGEQFRSHCEAQMSLAFHLSTAFFNLSQALSQSIAASQPLWSLSASAFHLSSSFGLSPFLLPAFRPLEIQSRDPEVEGASCFVLKEKGAQLLKLPSAGEVPPPFPGRPCNRTQHRRTFCQALRVLYT